MTKREMEEKAATEHGDARTFKYDCVGPEGRFEFRATASAEYLAFEVFEDEHPDGSVVTYLGYTNPERNFSFVESAESLRARLAWYESDEALELFKTGRIVYPEITVAVLKDQLAKLEG